MSGTELCGLCPVNVLDGKEDCKKGAIRAWKTYVRVVCSWGGYVWGFGTALADLGEADGS